MSGPCQQRYHEFKADRMVQRGGAIFTDDSLLQAVPEYNPTVCPSPVPFPGAGNKGKAISGNGETERQREIRELT